MIVLQFEDQFISATRVLGQKHHVLKERRAAGEFFKFKIRHPHVFSLYHSRARNGHGGDEVTLGIKTYLRDLQPDPDDADISSGAVQFILPYVAPQDIFFE